MKLKWVMDLNFAIEKFLEAIHAYALIYAKLYGSSCLLPTLCFSEL